MSVGEFFVMPFGCFCFFCKAFLLLLYESSFEDRFAESFVAKFSLNICRFGIFSIEIYCQVCYFYEKIISGILDKY